jgi:hypothetical protein
VEPRTHRLTLEHDLLVTALQRFAQLRMLRLDQKPPLVRIGRIEQREIDLLEDAVRRWSREPAPLRLLSVLCVQLSETSKAGS